MNEQEFRARTKAFGIRVIRAVQSFPKDFVARTIGQQLLKSGTSVGANYRSACRAKSKRDMISKLKIAEEEADEAAYWMETLIESGFMNKKRLNNLLKEADEITAMLVASIRTLRKGDDDKKQS